MPGFARSHKGKLDADETIDISCNRRLSFLVRRYLGVSFYLTLNPVIQYAPTMLQPGSQFYGILSEYKGG